LLKKKRKGSNMGKKPLEYFKLLLSEQELKMLKLALMTRFAYTTIALSEDIDDQIRGLIALVEYDPIILGSSYFGRTDN